MRRHIVAAAAAAGTLVLGAGLALAAADTDTPGVEVEQESPDTTKLTDATDATDATEATDTTEPEEVDGTEPEEVDGTEADALLEADGPEEAEDEVGPKKDNHGAAVSAAAHDKVDDGTPHGQSVSEVARDRSTLPAQAQARGPKSARAGD